MRAPRAAVLRAEDLAAAFIGSGLLAVIELLDLARAPGSLPAAWVVAGLYAGVGLLLAAALTLSRLLGDQGQRPLTSAIGASLLSVLLFLPLGTSLFQGAWASRLPGARMAVLWVPVLGVALATLAVWVGGRLTLSRLGRLGLGIGLPVIAIELDILNRNILRSEYPDLHTILLLACCVLAAVGVRLLLEHLEPVRLSWTWGRVRWPLLVVTGAGLSLLVAALAFGLRDKAGRRALADHGMMGRLLARAAKAALDVDRDGYAAVLNGGDCREGNAAIHPDAREIVRNGVDEDCDGSDLQSTFSLPGDAARRERLLRWREEDEDVRAFIRRASHLNVLLVVVDALRADTFTPTPQNVQAFPNVFALRKRARWFTRAFSPAAGTDLSMTGVLTGKANPMTGSELTLSEILTATGYRSHAVIPEEVLRFISPTMLTRGFGSHDMIPADARSASANAGLTSARTTSLALRFLDSWVASGPDRPFFLWVHYFDVHEHHQIRSDTAAVVAANGGKVPNGKRDKYRAMVKVVDGALGRLQQGLAQRGLADNTIVVLLSDHGESLGEEPRLPEFHGRFLYNPLVHVPLAVLIPGVPPQEIAHPVSLLDVPATIQDLLRVPRDSLGNAEAEAAEGESLLPLLLDAPPSLFEPPRVLPLHESDQYGLVAWPHKLLVRPGAELVELYDLSRDFDERVDRAESDPDLVRALLRAYRTFPSVPLDRTPEGRRRWELKAQASRPTPEDLTALEDRIPPAPTPGSWRPSTQRSISGASIQPIRRKSVAKAATKAKRNAAVKPSRTTAAKPAGQPAAVKSAPAARPAGQRPAPRRSGSRPTPPAPPWRGWDPVLR